MEKECAGPKWAGLKMERINGKRERKKNGKGKEGMVVGKFFRKE